MEAKQRQGVGYFKLSYCHTYLKSPRFIAIGVQLVGEVILMDTFTTRLTACVRAGFCF